MSYDRVDRAIAEGKLWRAKEILEGRLGTPNFDRELLLRYGKVLLAMGDLIVAGRVLFFPAGVTRSFGKLSIFSCRGTREGTQNASWQACH